MEAQAPMVEPELTEVGELHSLTDWQVSEASEEAELDEFCSVNSTTTQGKEKTSHQQRKTKSTHKQTDKHRRRGRMRKAEG